MPNMIFFFLRLLGVHFICERHFGHSFSSLILISGSLIALFMNDGILPVVHERMDVLEHRVEAGRPNASRR